MLEVTVSSVAEYDQRTRNFIWGLEKKKMLQMIRMLISVGSLVKNSIKENTENDHVIPVHVLKFQSRVCAACSWSKKVVEPSGPLDLI